MADLVASDPQWARAAAQLSGAVDSVAGDLARLPAPALPDDVAARLDRVLHAAGGDTGSGQALPTGEPTVRHPDAPAPHPRRRGPGSGHPTGARRPPGSQGRGGRRRRALRWGSGLAVAVAALALAAVGLDTLQFASEDSGGGHTAATRDNAEDAPAAPGAIADEPVYLATGTDYQRGVFPPAPPAGETFGMPPQAEQDGEPRTAREPEIAGQPDEAVAPALAHLMPLPTACHAEIIAGYDPGTTMQVVDYAWFEGQPALVIWVTTGDGQRWVSVAGPDCGTGAAGADERHRTQVG